jgi:hypothetical protein
MIIDVQAMSNGFGGSGETSLEMSAQSRTSAPLVHSALKYQARASTDLGRISRETRKFDPDRNALEKLVLDLTLSVPLVLIMSLYYPVGKVFFL